MSFDIICRIINISRNGRAQLVHPLISLRPVSADQGVHGQHIHLIVVGQGGLLLYPVADPVIVNNMVASDQACQIKSLAGRIESHGSLAGILADALCGDMLMAQSDDIRPDFI